MASQTWDAGKYAHNARFVAELGAPLVDLLDPRPGERILDLGCGDGALTRQIAAGGAQVVGVDASEELVRAAVAAGVDARVMDAQRLGFQSEFDAVFSNAALHWMPDADAVLGGVARALRPGGRFVAELGGHGNVAAIVVALLAVVRSRPEGAQVCSPWYFPTAGEYRAKIERAGFAVEKIIAFARPTVLPTGIGGWLDVFAQPFLGTLPPAERPAALREAVELLRPALCGADGTWTADYVRLRFKARIPPDMATERNT